MLDNRIKIIKNRNFNNCICLGFWDLEGRWEYNILIIVLCSRFASAEKFWKYVVFDVATLHHADCAGYEGALFKSKNLLVAEHYTYLWDRGCSE